MRRGYMISSGYFTKNPVWSEWFFDLWWKNLMRYARPLPRKVLIIGQAGCKIPNETRGTWLNVDGDLGYCDHLLNHEKPWPYVANGIAICIAALTAYAEELDYIYMDQDKLCFGPWVETMYRELGDGGFIMGRERCMPCANGLFLVRHSFILPFVNWYLSSQREDRPENISEHKFARWQAHNPTMVKYHSFGCERDRPIPINDPVFHIQKLTPQELILLRSSGLIECNSIPKGISVFSNHTHP